MAQKLTIKLGALLGISVTILAALIKFFQTPQPARAALPQSNVLTLTARESSGKNLGAVHTTARSLQYQALVPPGCWRRRIVTSLAKGVDPRIGQLNVAMGRKGLGRMLPDRMTEFIRAVMSMRACSAKSRRRGWSMYLESSSVSVRRVQRFG